MSVDLRGKGVGNVLILFFLLWILLSGSVTVETCLSGAAASAAVYYFCTRVLGYRMGQDRRALRRLGSLLSYLWYLLVEMLKAGWVVMRLIYSRDRRMEPRLIWFQTDVKGEVAQSVLANSITLTAGTITVAAEKGRFCVHTLDRSLAEGIEDSEFARRLNEMDRAERRHAGFAGQERTKKEK